MYNSKMRINLFENVKEYNDTQKWLRKADKLNFQMVGCAVRAVLGNSRK